MSVSAYIQTEIMSESHSPWLVRRERRKMIAACCQCHAPMDMILAAGKDGRSQSREAFEYVSTRHCLIGRGKL